jgi:hypothetical protein
MVPNAMTDQRPGNHRCRGMPTLPPRALPSGHGKLNEDDDDGCLHLLVTQPCPGSAGATHHARPTAATTTPVKRNADTPLGAVMLAASGSRQLPQPENRNVAATDDGEHLISTQAVHAHHPLQPEVQRERRNERQRRYRISKKTIMSVTEQQVQDTRAEIHHLKQENAEFQERVTALQSLHAFWDGLLVSLSAAVANIRHVISNISSGQPRDMFKAGMYMEFVTRFYEPTDQQLEIFLMNMTFQQLDEMSIDFNARKHQLLQKWLADPEQRANIEAKLHKMENMRCRGGAIIAAKRPKEGIEILARRMLPPGPNGEPNYKIYDVIEALQLTPRQKLLLEGEWQRYVLVVSQAREQADQAVQLVVGQYSDPSVLAALAMVAADGAECYLKLIDTATVLESYPEKEAQALLNLALFFNTKLLSKSQRLVAMAATSPYTLDLLQFCTVLFG